MKFLGLNFGSAEMLSKVEQKKVRGGSGYCYWCGGSGGGVSVCEANCPGNTIVSTSGDTCSSCTATDYSGNSGGYVTCTNSSGTNYKYCPTA